MQPTPFPASKSVFYAFGMMGWSIMINLISVILVYFYAPPSLAGIPPLISQAVILGIFNIIFLITVSGRLTDAIWDPFIAQQSDKSRNKKGRRIPFMKRAIIPSFLFCFLIFFPLHKTMSSANAVWLVCTLTLFYISTTTYIIPYNALLPELAPASKDKVRLATWQSVGYVFGIGIASVSLNIADYLLRHGLADSKIQAIQYTAIGMAVLGAVSMSITAFYIDEKAYSSGKPGDVPIRKALKQALTNKNFIYFIVADVSNLIGITIIATGLLYFVTVLLKLPETSGSLMMITMILVSFAFYPAVNYMADKIGKKPIVIFSLLWLAAIFAGIYFLGKVVSITPWIQIYSLVIAAAVPLAALSILPVAILSEIIAKDTRDTGSNMEAVYFAVRYFFMKLAQTLGIAIFSMLLIYGKDVGHDLGIRLNGVVGFVLCIVAAITFTRFKEIKEADISQNEK